VSIATTGNYTYSVFLKANGRDFVTVFVRENSNSGATYIGASVNLSDGTASSVTGTANVTNVGNGWYRVAVSGSVDSGTRWVQIRLREDASTTNYAGDITKGVLAWGAQLEEGAFATSYIPTATAAATRSAEIVQVDPVSSFVNLNEGTLFTEFKLLDNQANSTARGVISLWDGNAVAAGPTHFLYNTFIWRGPKNGSQQNMSSLGYDTNLNKMSFAYSTSGRAASKNGASVITDTGDSSLPAANRLSFGAASTFGTIAFGVGGYSKHIRKIAYWPKRLTNTLLEQLTT
jgi:hypothetical protein